MQFQVMMSDIKKNSKRKPKTLKSFFVSLDDDDWLLVSELLLSASYKYPEARDILKKMENQMYETVDSLYEWRCALKGLKAKSENNEKMKGEIKQLKLLVKDIQKGRPTNNRLNCFTNVFRSEEKVDEIKTNKKERIQ